MSFPISLAIFENSLLFPVFAFPCPLSRRCLCSSFEGYEERLRIDSTQALNSFVLSCTGMLGMPELLFVILVNETSDGCQRRMRSRVQGLLCTSSGADGPRRRTVAVIVLKRRSCPVPNGLHSPGRSTASKARSSPCRLEFARTRLSQPTLNISRCYCHSEGA
jgi:hypothetical protein